MLLRGGPRFLCEEFYLIVWKHLSWTFDCGPHSSRQGHGGWLRGMVRIDLLLLSWIRLLILSMQHRVFAVYSVALKVWWKTFQKWAFGPCSSIENRLLFLSWTLQSISLMLRYIHAYKRWRYTGPVVLDWFHRGVWHVRRLFW